MGRSTAKAGVRLERPERLGRKPLPGRRALLLCLLAALAVAASFALVGCKYSDVLTQHTEDPDLGELDENAEPIYESNPDADLEMDLANFSLDDSDDIDTQVAKLPHYDPNAPDNGPTKQRIKSQETPHDEEASEGEESEEEADRDGGGTDENASKGGRPNDDEEDEDDDDDGGDDEDTDDEQDDGGTNENDDNENQDNENTIQDSDSDETTEPTTGANNGDTVIVDPEDGTTEDASKGTVAAVGEYATIAQMLGGAGALTACDRSWLDARNGDGCFSGELERMQVAFSGDGSAAGSCDVDMLVETVKPSTVLWDSTANIPNLTEDERSALEEAGITVQVVPHLGEQNTEDYEVKAAVAEVAEVLSGASGLQFDPTNVYLQYSEFHDSVLAGCYESNGGYSYKATDSSYAFLYQDTPLNGLTDSTTERAIAVYVDDMQSFGSSAKVTQSVTTASGDLRLAHDGQTLDISDGVALSAATSSGGYMLIDYYLQLAGFMNNAYDNAQPSPQGKRYILMPGTTDAFGTSGNYAKRSTGTAFFYNAGDGTVAANWQSLGMGAFKTVLVANPDIADAFAESAAKSDGLYHMEGAYDVAVVPAGLEGAWAEGHIDSFLLTPWMFRFRGSDNLSAAAESAQSFYTTFLRCSNWEGAVSDWDTVRTGLGG